MASIADISLSAAINLLSALAFLLAFAVLRLQPFNDRVYFPKWYLKGIRGSPTGSSAVKKFVNLDFKTYIRFLNWMPAALHMPEPELIDHAGLDSAVFIRIYLLGLKIFAPITLLAFIVLVPVNWTGNTLEKQGAKNLTYSDIDKISISNIPFGSDRFWAHIAMSYVFSSWTCYSLYKEYKNVAAMRLRFLAAESRRPDQFTVLVRNVPPDTDESVTEHIEHFFCVNHPDHYLMHQTGFMGLLGTKVDAIDHYTESIETLSKEEAEARETVINNPDAIMPAAFVSFKTRWGAVVCAQTQQTSDPTIWLTDWAPEPRDVFWENLAIPYFELNMRRLVMTVALFFLTFCFMIPIAFVQSLANIESIMKVLPFLKPIIQEPSIKSLIQGFLPGIALKIFLAVLPKILMTMSKVEGFTSLSSLDRRSASKYYLFILINVFLGSVITGTAFQQLQQFLNQTSTEFTKTVGSTIPMKATFFITYIMVDGWAGIAAEVLRLVPLITFHLKNAFLVKTEQDRESAMDPGSLDFATSEPRIQLYFMLGHVYAPVTPFLLPFIVIFFGFAYLIFRHQIINVYNQQYESGGAFWPDVHGRVVMGLIISQILLMGLLSTRGTETSTLVLIAQPILTFWFHRYCKGLFESAFVKFPLQGDINDGPVLADIFEIWQEAMVKDTLERAVEPNLNLRVYLQNAYVHPVFKDNDFEKPAAVDDEEENPLIKTTRHTRRGSKSESETGGC
ncbi:CSC1-like protein [Vigna angularis]|uniref:CSC1-like protein n=1 Tax=Phaseolus angularis TaxID=3914 RepID=A0A8T0L196_PHAAN|nr:CSC1-like protein [Vigna angularis]